MIYKYETKNAKLYTSAGSLDLTILSYCGSNLHPVNNTKEGGAAYEVSHQALTRMFSDKFYREYLYCVIEKMLQ